MHAELAAPASADSPRTLSSLAPQRLCLQEPAASENSTDKQSQGHGTDGGGTEKELPLLAPAGGSSEVPGHGVGCTQVLLQGRSYLAWAERAPSLWRALTDVRRHDHVCAAQHLPPSAPS